VPTYVTRVVVTQTDEPPPADELNGVPGYTRWIVEWTKNDGRRDTEFHHTHYSIDGARRHTRGLLQTRTPGTSVQDVLTLVGFDEG
jgi:hypothetical protein